MKEGEAKKKADELLEQLFDKLKSRAYTIDTHSYYYKECNQVIREFFETEIKLEIANKS